MSKKMTEEMEICYPTMMIDRIGIYPFDIELEEPFKIATMTVDKAYNILIHIETNQGLDGWGEGSSFRSIVGETQAINLAAAQEIRSILLGKNPLNLHQRVREMEAWLPFNPTLRSAFDMALYDIAAKFAGLPLYAFLGGEKRVIETDLTIGIGDPAVVAEKALTIVDKGFNKIKTKVGIDSKADFLRLKNIREAVGTNVKIRIDANQGWDRVTAANNLRKFEAFDIEFCEQPLRADDLAGMKYLSTQTSIPIMADESIFSPQDALKIIEMGAAPMLNIKLSKSGGIFNGVRIAHIAESARIPCMTGCMSESNLANTAFAHFAMAHPIVQYFDLDANLGHINEPIHGGVILEQGEVKFPEEELPGIGAWPETDYIESLESL